MSDKSRIDTIKEVAKIKDIGYSHNSHQFTGYSVDRGMLQEMCEHADRLEQVVASLQAEKLGHLQLIDGQAEQVEALQARVESLEHTLKSDNDTWNSQETSYKEQIAELTAALKAETRAHEISGEQIAGLIAERDALKRGLGNAMDTCEKLEAERDWAGTELTNFRAETNALHNKLQAATAMAERLASEARNVSPHDERCAEWDDSLECCRNARLRAALEEWEKWKSSK